MRDKRFITEHRGGLLIKEHHRQLIEWACKCAEHVFFLYDENLGARLKDALITAKDWAAGNATVGSAIKASVDAHEVARKSFNPTSIAVARSVGQAVATAHMADHSLGAAMYALKAVKNANRSIDEERKWQNEQLPSEIKELVLTTRPNKEQLIKN
ncbi:MAG: hypothetical protein NT092_09525 [Bacteroidia bacterium]|nr:hypothetical protein [Bacteroidia bacterium]